MTTEFLDFITFNEELTRKDYLYFIQPVEEENQIQNWEGGVKFIERNSKFQVKGLHEKLEEIQKELVSELKLIKDSTNNGRTLQNNMQTTIDSNLDTKIKEIQTTTNAIHSEFKTTTDAIQSEFKTTTNAIQAKQIQLESTTNSIKNELKTTTDAIQAELKTTTDTIKTE